MKKLLIILLMCMHVGAQAQGEMDKIKPYFITEKEAEDLSYEKTKKFAPTDKFFQMSQPIMASFDSQTDNIYSLFLEENTLYTHRGATFDKGIKDVKEYGKKFPFVKVTENILLCTEHEYINKKTMDYFTVFVIDDYNVYKCRYEDGKMSISNIFIGGATEIGNVTIGSPEAEKKVQKNWKRGALGTTWTKFYTNLITQEDYKKYESSRYDIATKATDAFHAEAFQKLSTKHKTSFDKIASAVANIDKIKADEKAKDDKAGQEKEKQEKARIANLLVKYGQPAVFETEYFKWKTKGTPKIAYFHGREGYFQKRTNMMRIFKFKIPMEGERGPYGEYTGNEIDASIVINKSENPKCNFLTIGYDGEVSTTVASPFYTSLAAYNKSYTYWYSGWERRATTRYGYPNVALSFNQTIEAFFWIDGNLIKYSPDRIDEVFMVCAYPGAKKIDFSKERREIIDYYQYHIIPAQQKELIIIKK